MSDLPDATTTNDSTQPGPGRFSRWVGAVAGRRASWFVIAIWIIAALGFGALQPKLQESVTNDSINFLPKSADSTLVQTLNNDARIFEQRNEVPAFIVVQSDGGDTPLTADQKQLIDDLVAAIDEASDDIPTYGGTTSPNTPGAAQQGLVSSDGSTAVIRVTLEDPDSDEIIEAAQTLRELVADAESDAGADADGLEIYVTGPAGIAADAIKVFEGIDGKLLIGTSVLVLVLLLIIYRSPVIALVPLFAAFAAYAVAAGVLYLLIEPFDLVVSSQTTGIMLILIFGAGTDYCLLVVARYREELATTERPHEAMQAAVSHTSPAIISSAGTVVAAMFVLLLAEDRSVAALGPALIVGVTCAMLAGLTLLPALLAVLGRRSFWPFIPQVGEARRERRNLYHRTGNAIAAHPWRWLLPATGLLLVLSLGLVTQENGPVGQLDQFTTTTESEQGITALAEELAPGEIAPGTIIVSASDVTDLTATTGAVMAALQSDEAVAQAFPGAVGSHDGRAYQQITYILDADPYATAAEDAIDPLRERLEEALPEDGEPAVLVGGPTAEQADLNAAAARDARIIVPGILAAILIILIVLLRALVAPLHLVASVLLSFAATMGAMYVLFLGILDEPGIPAGVVTFIFLFTAALGVDYNIFLITRIREEAARLGTRDGTIRALALTGGVITSAGVILAGTFAILAVLPLLPLQQLGIAVAVGVLLDTIVVRTVIVPSLMFILGPRNWWPGPVPLADRDPSPDG